MRKRIVGPAPATLNEVVNLTARQLKQGQRGYSDKYFKKGSSNKDWMNPRVKRVLGMYANRHLFSNPLSSRAAFETFVTDAGIIAMKESKSQEAMDAALKRHLLGFTFGIKTDRRMSTGEKIKLVRISLESLSKKLSSFSEMGRGDWSRAQIHNNPKKQVDAKDKAYYIGNARDAMGHIMFEHVLGTKDGVTELIRCARSLEATLLR